MSGLSGKMWFAREYVKEFCVEKAAVRAGYAETFAKRRSTKLLKDGRVQVLVREMVATRRTHAHRYRYRVKRDLAELLARRASGQNHSRGSGDPFHVEPTDSSVDGTEVLTEVLAGSLENGTEVLAEHWVDGTEVLAEVLGLSEAREGTEVLAEVLGLSEAREGTDVLANPPEDGTEVLADVLAGSLENGTDVLANPPVDCTEVLTEVLADVLANPPVDCTEVLTEVLAGSLERGWQRQDRQKVGRANDGSQMLGEWQRPTPGSVGGRT